MVDKSVVNLVFSPGDEHWELDQDCPDCGNLNLRTLECYASGSNIYWVTQCTWCLKVYTYDTYSKTLRLN